MTLAALALHWILWTNPTTNQRMEWSVSADGDSTLSPVCWGEGEPLGDLAEVRVWRWPVTGGMPYIFETRPSRGMEGRADSTQVPEDAHYYLSAVDTAGNEGCISNIILIGNPVGVEGGVTQDAIVSMRIFDVRGRLVRRREPNAIYFYRATWRSGRITSGKLPPIMR